MLAEDSVPHGTLQNHVTGGTLVVGMHGGWVGWNREDGQERCA